MVALVGVIAVVASTLLLSSSPASSQTGQIRTSDNYRLGPWQDPARGKTGPGVAVNPNNPNNVVETQIELTSAECEYNSSLDGGTTWNIGGKLTGPAPAFPQGPGSCSVLGHGASAVDNGLEFGTGLNVYAAFASAPCGTPGEGCAGTGSFSALVARSTNGGQTFGSGVVAIPAGALGLTGDMGFPKIDVFAGAGTAGADKIVIATNPTRPAAGAHSNAGAVLVATSMDNGATWSAPVAVNPAPSASDPFGAGEHTHPKFGSSSNTIYVAWRTVRVRVSPPDPASPTPLPPGTVEPGFLRVGKSTDNGATWTVTDATNVRAEPGFGGSSFPRLAVKRGAPDNLYLVWNQDAALYGAAVQAQDHFMIKTSQVWFSRSIDANATWTDRQMLSEPVVAGWQTQTRHPNVEIAPNGRVDVAWHDRRHMVRPRFAGNSQGPACLHTHFPCVESKLGDTYWAYSNGNGATGTFSESRRISDRSHNNDVGYDYRFSTYWDFGPVMAYQGNNILHAWMDSREGNFNTDTQDIYLAKTNFNGSANVPIKPIGTYNPSGFAVRFSQLAQPGGSEAKQASTFASTFATRVVIANQNDVPGILAGAVLARAFVGPLLVTPAEGLPQHVKDEVQRVEPVGAYLIGDTTKLSAQVEADLISVGVPEGWIIPDAVLTAGTNTISSPSGSFDLADINHEVHGPNIPAGTTFRYVTTITSAELSQAPTASGPASLHIPRIVRLGGSTPESVSAAVARQLDRRTPTERLAGSPAFDAVIIADPNSKVASFASILAVHRRLPYLFVSKTQIPTETNQAMTDLNINKTLVIQGANALDPAIATQLSGQGQNPTTFAGSNAPATSEAILQASITTWGLPANQVFVQDSDNALHGALLGQPGGRIGGLQLAVPGGDPVKAENRLNNLNVSPGLDRLITSNVTASGQGTSFGVFRPSTGTFFVQNGTTTNFGTAGDIPVYADYDGNGTNDVAVFRPSTGTWFVQGGATTNWGTAGDIAVPCDYDGNGTADIAVFRPDTGFWFVQGGATTNFGTSGDIPVPGDYDGDGTCDIAVFRPSTGTWFVEGGPTVNWGTSGDIPVPGDYDGNGTTDIAVFRPSTGTWFIIGGPTVNFGTSGDIPVPADYDGDGNTDIAVFRPSTGQLLIEGQPAQNFGTSGDVPLTMSPSTYSLFF